MGKVLRYGDVEEVRGEWGNVEKGVGKCVGVWGRGDVEKGEGRCVRVWGRCGEGGWGVGGSEKRCWERCKERYGDVGGGAGSVGKVGERCG